MNTLLLWMNKNNVFASKDRSKNLAEFKNLWFSCFFSVLTFYSCTFDVTSGKERCGLARYLPSPDERHLRTSRAVDLDDHVRGGWKVQLLVRWLITFQKCFWIHCAFACVHFSRFSSPSFRVPKMHVERIENGLAKRITECPLIDGDWEPRYFGLIRKFRTVAPMVVLHVMSKNIDRTCRARS